MTDEERDHFNERGYLIVEEAIPEDRIRTLTAPLDRIWDGYPADPAPPPNSRLDASGLFYPNFVGRDPAFLDMVDWPVVFPKVWGLLGWTHRAVDRRKPDGRRWHGAGTPSLRTAMLVPARRSGRAMRKTLRLLRVEGRHQTTRSVPA